MRFMLLWLPVQIKYKISFAWYIGLYSFPNQRICFQEPTKTIQLWPQVCLHFVWIFNSSYLTSAKDKLTGFFCTCKLARGIQGLWTFYDSSPLFLYHECSLFLLYKVPTTLLSFSDVSWLLIQFPKEQQVSSDF